MFFFKKRQILNDLESSSLFNETNFYPSFIKDLLNAKNEVIIESAFLSNSRMNVLLPVFEKLIQKGVKVHVITRDPMEHCEDFRYHATELILKYSEVGVKITLLKGYHHRKLAIVDKRILWEGSLNILSFTHSQEVMRRIEGERASKEMLHFINLKNII